MSCTAARAPGYGCRCGPVRLVWLAAARDPAQVPVAVAAALGIRALPSVAAAEALADALGPAAAAAGAG